MGIGLSDMLEQYQSVVVGQAQVGNSPYKEDIARLFREGLELGRLHGKTILVAGATGLVGGCVVDVLMQNPARCYKVIAAGRNKERARQKFAAYWEDESFFFAEIDVTQPVIKSMDRMIGEPVYNELAEGADYIIDAASNASPNFFKQNPDGRNLLSAAHRKRAPHTW